MSRAGKFWGDVWAFQAPPHDLTAASLNNPRWQALGMEIGEEEFSQVDVTDARGMEGEDIKKLTPGADGKSLIANQSIAIYFTYFC